MPGGAALVGVLPQPGPHPHALAAGLFPLDSADPSRQPLDGDALAAQRRRQFGVGGARRRIRGRYPRQRRVVRGDEGVVAGLDQLLHVVGQRGLGSLRLSRLPVGPGRRVRRRSIRLGEDDATDHEGGRADDRQREAPDPPAPRGRCRRVPGPLVVASRELGANRIGRARRISGRPSGAAGPDGRPRLPGSARAGERVGNLGTRRPLTRVVGQCLLAQTVVNPQVAGNHPESVDVAGQRGAGEFVELPRPIVRSRPHLVEQRVDEKEARPRCHDIGRRHVAVSQSGRVNLGQLMRDDPDDVERVVGAPGAATCQRRHIFAVEDRRNHGDPPQIGRHHRPDPTRVNPRKLVGASCCIERRKLRRPLGAAPICNPPDGPRQAEPQGFEHVVSFDVHVPTPPQRRPSWGHRRGSVDNASPPLAQMHPLLG